MVLNKRRMNCGLSMFKLFYSFDRTAPQNNVYDIKNYKCIINVNQNVVIFLVKEEKVRNVLSNVEEEVSEEKYSNHQLSSRTDGQIYRINEKPISNHLLEISKYEDTRFSRNEYSSTYEYYNAINNIIDKWANKSEYGLLFTLREKEEYYIYHFNKLYERNRDFIKNLPKTTFTLFKKLKINTFRVFVYTNYNLCFLVTLSSRRNIIRNNSNHMIFDLINNYNIYRSSTFFDLQQCSPIALYLTEMMTEGLINVIQCVTIVHCYLCDELEQNIHFIFSFVKSKIENNIDHNLNILVKEELLSSIPVFDQDRHYSHLLNCSSANVVLRFLDFPSERIKLENSNYIVCEFFTPFSSRNQLREHLFENLLPNYFYKRSYIIRLFEFFCGKTRYIRSCLKIIVENGKLSDIDMICQD
ncbi:hypothetical protein ABK040_001527 [Willaertia magna]